MDFNKPIYGEVEGFIDASAAKAYFKNHRIEYTEQVEERTVVCLEFYGSVCSQDFVIKLEKFVGCQSSSCMAGFRPRIGEVQVDT